jgi:thiamine-phosphate pyrophosphorylase
VTLCLVTDRRRLAAAIDIPVAAVERALVQQVAAAAQAGVDLVQVREPDLEAGALVSLVRQAVRACEGTRARVVVNDRLDVALAAGAAGVQLKETSLGLDAARRLAPPGFIVGCSVHTPLAAAARRSADFLIAGTILPTVSRARTDYLEWQGLSAVVAAAAGTPVLGIGGLDLPGVPDLVASGASGLAAIGAFIPPAGAGLSEFVQKRVMALRFAFDSTRREP